MSTTEEFYEQEDSDVIDFQKERKYLVRFVQSGKTFHLLVNFKPLEFLENLKRLIHKQDDGELKSILNMCSSGYSENMKLGIWETIASLPRFEKSDIFHDERNGVWTLQVLLRESNECEGFYDKSELRPLVVCNVIEENESFSSEENS